MSSDPPNGGPLRRPILAVFDERRWLVVGMVAAWLGLATLTLAFGPRPLLRGQGVLLVLFACAPVVVLRRWPLPVLSVAAVAVSIEIASGYASLPLVVMLGLSTYFVALRLPRPLSMRAGVAAAIALGVALVYAAIAPRTAPLAVEAIEGFVPLVAAWFVGDSVAARRRYIAGLAEQAERERAAEIESAHQEVREERVRIARELHDVVAHTLAVITVQAGVGRRLMAKCPEEASAALESIEAIGRTAQDELRVVLGLLRDEDGEAASLAPAPMLVDVKDLVEKVRASGTPVELRTSGCDRPLSPALELSIYRIAQEALTNVVKHAPGARATVELEVSAHAVRIEITDEVAPRRPGHWSPKGAMDTDLSGCASALVRSVVRSPLRQWPAAVFVCSVECRSMPPHDHARPCRRRSGIASHRIHIAHRCRGGLGGRRGGA
ncbi:MAG: sensor histidine kinase [Acidimicrobiales bacterium]